MTGLRKFCCAEKVASNASCPWRKTQLLSCATLSESAQSYPSQKLLSS